MFPVTVEGNGSLSGVQILRGHRETYAIQFIARTGDQIAEIEATGSDMDGWKHQFLSSRVTFATTADERQRILVLGAFPILQMTYVAPRG
jgi:hypothetical protein